MPSAQHKTRPNSAALLCSTSWAVLLGSAAVCIAVEAGVEDPRALPGLLRILLASVGIAGLAACACAVFCIVYLELIPSLDRFRWIARHGSPAGYGHHLAAANEAAAERARTRAGRWLAHLRSSREPGRSGSRSAHMRQGTGRHVPAHLKKETP